MVRRVGRQICDQLPILLDADHVQAGARADPRVNE